MKTIIYILFVAVLMFAACEKDYPLSSIGNTEGSCASMAISMPIPPTIQ